MRGDDIANLVRHVLTDGVTGLHLEHLHLEPALHLPRCEVAVQTVHAGQQQQFGRLSRTGTSPTDPGTTQASGAPTKPGPPPSRCSRRPP